ncbi:unnamed protein product, partial [Rotaria sp. Silwood1]
MAQQAPKSTFSIEDTCKKLKFELGRLLNEKDGDTSLAQVLMDRLIDNGRRLTMEQAGDILRFVFYPFGTGILNLNSQ